MGGILCGGRNDSDALKRVGLIKFASLAEECAQTLRTHRCHRWAFLGTWTYRASSVGVLTAFGGEVEDGAGGDVQLVGDFIAGEFLGAEVGDLVAEIVPLGAEGES